MPTCATAVSRCWPSGGRNDEIFAPEGALAFADDAPGAEIRLLDGGHFPLESHLDLVADHVRRFLGRTLT